MSRRSDNPPSATALLDPSSELVAGVSTSAYGRCGGCGCASAERLDRVMVTPSSVDVGILIGSFFAPQRILCAIIAPWLNMCRDV
jgi:hypothetical protein